jgi:ABC-type transport system involved in cytochrome bd biosynthesis fused ATPase/permease subunit
MIFIQIIFILFISCLLLSYIIYKFNTFIVKYKKNKEFNRILNEIKQINYNRKNGSSSDDYTTLILKNIEYFKKFTQKYIKQNN